MGKRVEDLVSLDSLRGSQDGKKAPLAVMIVY